MATTALKGNSVNTIGELPAVGSKSPGWDLVGAGLAQLTQADSEGKRVVLNIFPSVDTGICAASVRKFNELGIENVAVGSAFRSSFGEDFGVTMVDGPMAGLLARAVVVLDADGKVLHTQLVDEITTEPDYDAAVAALS